MTCETSAEVLSAYLDSQLAPRQRVLLTEHLAGCAACREEWLAEEKARALLRESAPYRMPRPLRERLSAIIDDPFPELSAPAGALARFLDGPRPRWAAAAACLLLWAAASTLRRPPPEPSIPIRALLAEHVRASRKAPDVHRSALASAPYETSWMRGAGR